MNDTLHWILQEAVREFGDTPRNPELLFTGACVSTVLNRVTGSVNAVDGRLISVLLSGRLDVVPLSGGYYQLINNSQCFC